jgi:hypothetical protein
LLPFFNAFLKILRQILCSGAGISAVGNINTGCRCQAMTGGIVGGLARVYLPFTWGIPFIVFGYDLAANIQATTTF